MILNLICIVEGQGEVSAVSILLRRLWQELAPTLDLRIAPPIRVSRKKLVKANELERAVDFAAEKVRSPRAILVLIDADDDCPAELGPQLIARAKQARSDVPTGVVLGQRHFRVLGYCKSLAANAVWGGRGCCVTHDLILLTSIPNALSRAILVLV